MTGKRNHLPTRNGKTQNRGARKNLPALRLPPAKQVTEICRLWMELYAGILHCQVELHKTPVESLRRQRAVEIGASRLDANSI